MGETRQPRRTSLGSLHKTLNTFYVNIYGAQSPAAAKEVPPPEAPKLCLSKHKHAERQDLVILKGSMQNSGETSDTLDEKKRKGKKKRDRESLRK